jgi:hypothetical protein
MKIETTRRYLNLGAILPQIEGQMSSICRFCPILFGLGKPSDLKRWVIPKFRFSEYHGVGDRSI